MKNSAASNASDRSQRQRQAREEWRRLCDAIEQAQGDELAKMCRHRFQFIRTYQMYGSKYDGLVTKLKHAAEAGDYTFFQERGVPGDVLDWRFAEQLLRDWNDKVHDKKRRLASIYQLQYGEPLDKAAETDEEAFQMNSVEPLHEKDALLLLSGRGQPSLSMVHIDELRDELQQLREELRELSDFVHAELDHRK